MDALEHDIAAGLLDDRRPPCLSLYQATHRQFPERQQDPIRFGNLVRDLEAALRDRYPDEEVAPLLAPFERLAGDRTFWNHTLDGLAVLASPERFDVYRLQRTVTERVVVGDRLYTKPLLRILQSVDRFQVLGVSRGTMRLFEGNRDAVDEIEPAEGVPRTLTDALGDELTEPHVTVASYGGRGGSDGATMVHGHGGKDAEEDIDAERYFRAVDRAVFEHHSEPTGLPLVLAALPEHQPLFRAVSHNRFLVEQGIEINPDALSADDIRQRAWQALEPRYLAEMDELADQFGSARANGLGDDDVAVVARSVSAGRVATLLVEARRSVPGRLDPVTAEMEPSSTSAPGEDDVLDDLIAMAQQRGSRVRIVPAEHMPSDTGVAAIYRY